MADASSSPLPPLYAAWLDELLAGPIPPETKATCHDCAMCEAGADHQQPNSRYFNPGTKCCTYLPELFNFLVGQILSDNDPQMARGRASVETRIAQTISVTPLGLGRPPRYARLYDNIAVHAFGRAQSLLCPHYVDEQGGLCGIWKYRNSVCSTFFCKYVRGWLGYEFWEAAKALLTSIEDDLSRWCVVELDIGIEALELLFKLPEPDQPRRIDLDSLEGRADPATQRSIWGKWSGREKEFYRECAHLVTALDWHGVLAVCGPQVRVRARLLQQGHQRITSNDIPARLKMGTFTIVESGHDVCRVHNRACGTGAFTLSSRLMRLLPYFDGRPTTEVVDQVIEKERLRITNELLLRLIDFQILTSCETTNT